MLSSNNNQLLLNDGKRNNLFSASVYFLNWQADISITIRKKNTMSFFILIGVLCLFSCTFERMFEELAKGHMCKTRMVRSRHSSSSHENDHSQEKQVSLPPSVFTRHRVSCFI